MTIRTLPAPCWRITVNPSAGSNHEDEFEAHYDSRDEALELFPAEERVAVQVEMYEEPCRTLACDGCGELAEDPDTWATLHFPGHDPSPAEVGLDEFDGRLLCDLCLDKAQRDELRKVGG
jgi:hypothetical protein